MIHRLLPRGRVGARNDETGSFRAEQDKEAAFDARDRGLRTVALGSIVGSVGRYHDFDHQFRLKPHMRSERLEQIKDAMRQGRPLQPVKLYQIKNRYYVLDGNHRIAAAKALGHDEILAHIVEFIPSKNTLPNLVYRQRAAFSDRTGLSAAFELTEIGQYEHLLDQIQQHHRFLGQQQPDEVPLEEAARDWHRTIYRPLCKIIRRSGLIEAFPGRTIDDLYTYISTHQWQKGRRRYYGSGIDPFLANDMEAFRKKMNTSSESEYPEMQRGITAFILMNVQAKREYKIIDKLYQLDAVREIHSVHGDVDLLVKIVLTRDLLSSDAETIAQFVHEVRQIQGVVSSRTLIPGISKIKGDGGPPSAAAPPKD